MKKRIAFLITISFIPGIFAGLLDPTLIRVANQTPLPLYVAIYYAQSATATRATTPCYLPPDNALSLELPSSKFLHSRRLCIATASDDLKTTLPLIATESCALGLFQPTDFTVILNRLNQTPHIMPTKEWLELPPAPSFIPHHLSTKLPAAEQQFCAQRLQKAHSAQEAYCGHSLPTRPLSIGVCASGGGFRAMLAMAGLMRGLEKTNILPLITRCMGLSGSTWFLFPWVLSGLSATEYTDFLVTWLSKGLIHTISSQYRDFSLLSAQKKAYQLPVSGIDLYGISLAYTLLKPLHPRALDLTMADVAAALNPEKHPLIMGTAVTRPQPIDHYEWLTVSPFNVQFLNDKLCLPPALLGAHFYNATQLTTLPSPLLCYYLAIFGSSFSISVRDALERTPQTLQQIAQRLLPSDWKETRWSNTKITAARIANPRRGMPESPHSDINTISLVDGGYLNNLPLEPCVRSAPTQYDLLFVLDCKQERPSRLRGMHLSHEEAQKHHPELPNVNEEEILTQPLSIHGNPLTGPVLLYCTVECHELFDPLFNPATDAGYATPRLMYTAEKAIKLVNLLEHVIQTHEPLIKKIIEVLAHKTINAPHLS